MLIFLAQPGAGEATKVAVRTMTEGLSTLAQTILGAIVILCLGIATLAVWKLSHVQDKRADDAKKGTERAEKQNDKMTKAFTEMQRSVDALVKAEENGQRLQQEQMNLLQQLKNSQDTTIRDAVLSATRRRSQSPPRP